MTGYGLMPSASLRKYDKVWADAIGVIEEV